MMKEYKKWEAESFGMQEKVRKSQITGNANASVWLRQRNDFLIK